VFWLKELLPESSARELFVLMDFLSSVPPAHLYAKNPD
jgi:hypothetical protein